jgi:hypothetical protein
LLFLLEQRFGAAMRLIGIDTQYRNSFKRRWWPLDSAAWNCGRSRSAPFSGRPVGYLPCE